MLAADDILVGLVGNRVMLTLDPEGAAITSLTTTYDAPSTRLTITAATARSLAMAAPGSGFLETPRARFGGVFLASAQTASQSAVPGASTPRVRSRSEAVDVDHGQLVGRHLNRFAIVMDLHELAPVDRRATGGRAGRRLERFAEMCEGLISRGRSHPGLLPLANLRFEVSRLLPAVSSEPDVATTPKGTRAETPPPPGP